MALITAHSFDDGYAVLGGPLPIAGAGKNGNGVQVGDNNAASISLPGVNPYVLGFDLKIVDSGGSFVYSTASIYSYGGLQYDPANQRLGMYVRNGPTTYTPIGSMPFNEWRYVEIRQFVATNTTGTVDLYIDGGLVASGTSLDSAQGMTTIRFGTGDTAALDAIQIDNLYYASTVGGGIVAPIGPHEMRTDFPNGNGANSGLLGSDGNQIDNYLNVDENPPSTADYNGSATEGAKDTYAFPNLATGEIPTAAIIRPWAAKTDSGAKFMRGVCRSGGTDYAGPSIALAEAYSALAEYILETDPDTGLAWTKAGYDAAEFGHEVRNS